MVTIISHNLAFGHPVLNGTTQSELELIHL
jgi:hypothetical protein